MDVGNNRGTRADRQTREGRSMACITDYTTGGSSIIIVNVVLAAVGGISAGVDGERGAFTITKRV